MVAFYLVIKENLRIHICVEFIYIILPRRIFLCSNLFIFLPLHQTYTWPNLAKFFFLPLLFNIATHLWRVTFNREGYMYVMLQPLFVFDLVNEEKLAYNVSLQKIANEKFDQ